MASNSETRPERRETHKYERPPSKPVNPDTARKIGETAIKGDPKTKK